MNHKDEAIAVLVHWPKEIKAQASKAPWRTTATSATSNDSDHPRNRSKQNIKKDSTSKSTSYGLSNRANQKCVAVKSNHLWTECIISYPLTPHLHTNYRHTQNTLTSLRRWRWRQVETWSSVVVKMSNRDGFYFYLLQVRGSKDSGPYTLLLRDPLIQYKQSSTKTYFTIFYPSPLQAFSSCYKRSEGNNRNCAVKLNIKLQTKIITSKFALPFTQPHNQSAHPLNCGNQRPQVPSVRLASH